MLHFCSRPDVELLRSESWEGGSRAWILCPSERQYPHSEMLTKEMSSMMLAVTISLGSPADFSVRLSGVFRPCGHYTLSKKFKVHLICFDLCFLYCLIFNYTELHLCGNSICCLNSSWYWDFPTPFFLIKQQVFTVTLLLMWEALWVNQTQQNKKPHISSALTRSRCRGCGKGKYQQRSAEEMGGSPAWRS